MVFCKLINLMSIFSISCSRLKTLFYEDTYTKVSGRQEDLHNHMRNIKILKLRLEVGLLLSRSLEVLYKNYACI